MAQALEKANVSKSEKNGYAFPKFRFWRNPEKRPHTRLTRLQKRK